MKTLWRYKAVLLHVAAFAFAAWWAVQCWTGGDVKTAVIMAVAGGATIVLGWTWFGLVSDDSRGDDR